jgi:membrane-bound lytic murein transglycosylase D
MQTGSRKTAWLARSNEPGRLVLLTWLTWLTCFTWPATPLFEAGAAPRTARAGTAAARAHGRGRSAAAKHTGGGRRKEHAAAGEDEQARRAIRGAPLEEDGPALGERGGPGRGDSLEAMARRGPLRAMRHFEEDAFPRAAARLPTGRELRGEEGPVPERAVTREPGQLPLPLRGGGLHAGGMTGGWAGGSAGGSTARAAGATVGATADTDRFQPPSRLSWLRDLQLPDLPLRWDPKLLRYLEFYRDTRSGQAIAGEWLRRSGRYQRMFEGVLGRLGLPRDLLVVAMVESSLDPRARSPAGAVGLWQMMPASARIYGLRNDFWVDERRSLERATEAALGYLKDLHARFGSWPMALAAYHAGHGAVLRSIGAFNTNDYWELCYIENGLPWETTLYVPKILATAIVLRNPASFGLGDLAQDAALVFDVLKVPSSTQLARLARTLGVEPTALAELNPELRRGRTPPGAAPYPLRVPAGTAAAFHGSSPGPAVGEGAHETYTVRFGERLADVAAACGLPPRELRRLNGVTDASDLRPGVRLIVPAGRCRAAKSSPAERVLAGSGSASASAGAGDAGDAGEPRLLVAVPDAAEEHPGRRRIFYRVATGDTLAELAQVFAVGEEAIAAWNRLDPGARLQPQQVLQLFVDQAFDSSGVLLQDPARLEVVTVGSDGFFDAVERRKGRVRFLHTVTRGETLPLLARRYRLCVADLARINRMGPKTDLGAGQRIVIYAPAARMRKRDRLATLPEGGGQGGGR